MKVLYQTKEKTGLQFCDEDITKNKSWYWHLLPCLHSPNSVNNVPIRVPKISKKASLTHLPMKCLILDIQNVTSFISYQI